MPGTLWVAAGGCGDAITATVLARRLEPPDGPAQRPAVLTWAWDRLVVDEHPGPRSPADFTELIRVGAYGIRVPPPAEMRAPLASTLPRLARELPADLYLVDPDAGAVGMAAQIRELQETRELPRVTLVDTGGDVLARGDEPGLRSPLADALSVAAVHDVDPGADVLVAAPGLDGELDEREVQAALRDVAATEPTLRLAGGDYDGVVDVFRWHPSEVTGLVYAAARGDRGAVRVAGSAGRAVLTDGSAAVWQVPVEAAHRRSRLAQALAGTASVTWAERRLADLGYGSELERERRTAARRHAAARTPRADLLAVVDLVLDAASAAREQAVTLRSIVQAVVATAGHVELEDLSDVLAGHHRYTVRPPLVSAAARATSSP